MSANAHLTFDEYAAMKEPAVNVIVNDYAVKLIEDAKKRGEDLTIAKAREIAKKEIPATFVPEWMKNLRVGANIAGTELAYLEGVKQSLDGVTELLSIIVDGGGYLDTYVAKHAHDFKRAEPEEGAVANGDE